MMDSTYLMMRHFEWKKNNKNTKKKIQKKSDDVDELDLSKIFPDYDENKKIYYENNLHRHIKPKKSCLRNSVEKPLFI